MRPQKKNVSLLLYYIIKYIIEVWSAKFFQPYVKNYNEWF